MKIDLDLLRRKIWFKNVKCYEVKRGKGGKYSEKKVRYIVKTDVPKERCEEGPVVTTVEDLRALVYRTYFMRRAVLKKVRAWEGDDGLLHVEFVVTDIKGVDAFKIPFDKYINALKVIKAEFVLGIEIDKFRGDEMALLTKTAGEYKHDIEELKKLLKVDKLYAEIAENLDDTIEVPY